MPIMSTTPSGPPVLSALITAVPQAALMIMLLSCHLYGTTLCSPCAPNAQRSCADAWVWGAQEWPVARGLPNSRVQLVIKRKFNQPFRNNRKSVNRTKQCLQGYVDADQSIAVTSSGTMPIRCRLNAPSAQGAFTPILFDESNCSSQPVATLAFRHDATQLFLAEDGGELVLRQMPSMPVPCPKALPKILGMLFRATRLDGSGIYKLENFCTHQPTAAGTENGKSSKVFVIGLDTR
eukprot:scpid84790/ scgid30294/ 